MVAGRAAALADHAAELAGGGRAVQAQQAEQPVAQRVRERAQGAHVGHLDGGLQRDVVGRAHVNARTAKTSLQGFLCIPGQTATATPSQARRPPSDSSRPTRRDCSSACWNAGSPPCRRATSASTASARRVHSSGLSPEVGRRRSRVQPEAGVGQEPEELGLGRELVALRAAVAAAARRRRRRAGPAGRRRAASGAARPARPPCPTSCRGRRGTTPRRRRRRRTAAAGETATTDGSPNSRRLARTAAAIGSAQTGRSPRSAASQPAGPPTPAPASSNRVPGPSASRSASQRSAPSLPLPRHPAGSRTRVRARAPPPRSSPATVSNSASIASLSSSVTAHSSSDGLSQSCGHLGLDLRRRRPHRGPSPCRTGSRRRPRARRAAPAPRRRPRRCRPRAGPARRAPARRRRRPGAGRGSAAGPGPTARRCRRRRRRRTAAWPRRRGRRRRSAATRAGLLTWLSTQSCAPARCFCGHPGGRRSTGGASGDSGTATGRPIPAARRGQPDAVEVEHLGHARAHARPAAVAGHAEDAVDADRGQPGQLLLEHDAVAVAAGQRRPEPTAGAEDLGGDHRRREVRPVGVLTDEQPVGDRRQDADHPAHRAGVERGDGQVGQDDRGVRRPSPAGRRAASAAPRTGPASPAAAPRKTQRCSASSQRSSSRTPPHGPNTIRFGQPRPAASEAGSIAGACPRRRPRNRPARPALIIVRAPGATPVLGGSDAPQTMINSGCRRREGMTSGAASATVAAS